MKTYGIALIALTALALTGLTGCSTDDVTGNDGAGADLSTLNGDAFAVIDGIDGVVNVEDATLEHPMQMQSPFHGGSFHRHHDHPRPEGAHLGRILHQLDINRDQMFDIMGLVRDHVERVRDQLEGLREANQPLIDLANAQREQVLESLRNGEIDRESARRQLHEISQATREAIRSNPDNEPFFDAICESRVLLLEEIRAVLTPEQQAIWDEWIAGLPETCPGSAPANK